MKIKDLLKYIEEYKEKYGEEVLEYDIYTEQIREDDKIIKKRTNEDGRQEWETIKDSEQWEYFKCFGYNTVFKKEKIFTINVNYWGFIKNFLFKFRTAVRLFFVCLFHKEKISAEMFENLFKLHEKLLKTATDDKLYRSEVYMNGNRIVSFWMYPSISKNPIDRIAELIKENEELKDQLFKQNIWSFFIFLLY